MEKLENTDCPHCINKGLIEVNPVEVRDAQTEAFGKSRQGLEKCSGRRR